MEWNVIQGILSLGVGGVLAIVIFTMYRKDKKTSETTLASLLDKVLDTWEKHTEVLTELTVLIKRLNGKS